MLNNKIKNINNKNNLIIYKIINNYIKIINIYIYINYNIN